MGASSSKKQNTSNIPTYQFKNVLSNQDLPPEVQQYLRESVKELGNINEQWERKLKDHQKLEEEDFDKADSALEAMKKDIGNRNEITRILTKYDKISDYLLNLSKVKKFYSRPRPSVYLDKDYENNLNLYNNQEKKVQSNLKNLQQMGYPIQKLKKKSLLPSL
jgi:hypothetical protein